MTEERFHPAYFTGWDFGRAGDPLVLRVSIARTFDCWEVLLERRYPPGAGIEHAHQLLAASTILEHWRGEPVDDAEVEALVAWPGHSLCRLHVGDLEQFWRRNGRQLSLFGREVLARS